MGINSKFARTVSYYSQNLYSGAEQYDLDRDAVREIQVSESETAKRSAVFANEEPVDETDFEHGYADGAGSDLGIHLHRVIVNHTIHGEHADPESTFLILDLELRNTSLTRSTVTFDPQAAVVRLQQIDDREPEPIRYDAVTEQMPSGLKEEVELTGQETKRGVMAFRIPAGVSDCQFEYAGHCMDVALGI